MMIRHWNVIERHIRSVYTSALQRSWRDGCGAALGDNSGSGDTNVETCRD